MHLIHTLIFQYSNINFTFSDTKLILGIWEKIGILICTLPSENGFVTHVQFVHDTYNLLTFKLKIEDVHPKLNFVVDI